MKKNKPERRDVAIQKAYLRVLLLKELCDVTLTKSRKDFDKSCQREDIQMTKAWTNKEIAHAGDIIRKLIRRP